MIYDLVMIGAGASGLFGGASLPNFLGSAKKPSVLILEKNTVPGKKLLLSGSGQCNLTHSGSIKDFIPCYGEQGKALRPVLYGYNNDSVVRFFEDLSIPLWIREDGKVFPKSLLGTDVLDALFLACKKNGADFRFSAPVTRLTSENGIWKLDLPPCASVLSRKVIVSVGGASYPKTGSDGSFFSVLSNLGIPLVPLRPALVPISTENYRFAGLSGISLPLAEFSLFREGKKKHFGCGPLLFTHDSFSGPGILNFSRYTRTGDVLSLSYLPGETEGTFLAKLKAAAQKTAKELLTILSDLTPLPKRLLLLLCQKAGLLGTEKLSSLSMGSLKKIAALLTGDTYTISGLAGFHKAMVTAGGVSLSAVNLKTMESKTHKGLYFCGEVLDVDGDTGGYNLQFAFSSAHLAVTSSVTSLSTHPIGLP